MSDQGLRDLERRARETGSTADEAAYLKALVRAGQRSRDAVALEAARGDEASRPALGLDADVPLRGLDGVDWARLEELAPARSNVPQILRTLLYEREDRRRIAFAAPWDVVVFPTGIRTHATATVLPFLFE